MPVRRLRRFWKDETAAVTLEAVIITPVLALAFLGSFVIFDAFRTYNTSIKATYAVADILSRQTSTVFPADIEGMAEIFEYMVRNQGDAQLRATQIVYDENEDDNQHTVEWSYATNNKERLFTANLTNLEDRLPIMADEERILLIETFIPYRPAFSIGLGLMTFENFTVTRPRYAEKVPFEEPEELETAPSSGTI